MIQFEFIYEMYRLYMKIEEILDEEILEIIEIIKYSEMIEVDYKLKVF